MGRLPTVDVATRRASLLYIQRSPCALALSVTRGHGPRSSRLKEGEVQRLQMGKGYAMDLRDSKDAQMRVTIWTGQIDSVSLNIGYFCFNR